MQDVARRIFQDKRTYLFYSSGVFSLFALLLINMSLWFHESYFPEVGTASEIARDWAKQPLVSIATVQADEQCPDNYEVIFYRPWLGTDIYCICESRVPGLLPIYHYRGECTGHYSNA